MKCQLCGVNDARYIASSGALTCAICPISHGLDSIRMSNVPELLALVRDFILEDKLTLEGDRPVDAWMWARQMREIVGKERP